MNNYVRYTNCIQCTTQQNNFYYIILLLIHISITLEGYGNMHRQFNCNEEITYSQRCIDEMLM